MSLTTNASINNLLHDNRKKSASINGWHDMEVDSTMTAEDTRQMAKVR